MEIIVRKATHDDIPELLRLEESWPEGERANEAQLRSRLDIYPSAFYVGHFAGQPERIIASSAGSPIVYDPNDLSLFSSWEHATNNGYYDPECTRLSKETIYVAASCMDKEHRNNTNYLNYIDQMLEQMKAEGIKTVVTGNVLPGYDRYCKKHGELSAVDYVFKTHHGKPIDPFLQILYRLGFVVPDEHHVIEDYYHDGPSRHYATIVVNDLIKRTPLSLS